MSTFACALRRASRARVLVGRRESRALLIAIDMDTHTLELLEFDKIRALVAARAACSLGKEAARRMEPSRDPGEIREPPGADHRDGRGALRRA